MDAILESGRNYKLVMCAFEVGPNSFSESECCRILFQRKTNLAMTAQHHD